MEIVDKVIEELRPIAEKLGEGAEFLWYTLVKQALIRGAIGTVFTVLFIVATVVAGRLAIKYFHAKQTKPVLNEQRMQRYRDELREAGARYSGYGKPEDYDDTDYDMCFGTALAVAVTTGLAAAGSAIYAIPRLLNPAYYAIEEILRTVS